MKINAMLEKRMSLEEIAAQTERPEGSADPRREQMDGYVWRRALPGQTTYRIAFSASPVT